jgi:hypothetical protein
MFDLVHALPDADCRGEMADHVDIDESRPERLAVTHIACQQLGLGREIGRADSVGMHLAVEIVEDPDPVAGAQKLLCEVCTDETGAPDDKNSL